MITLHQPFDFTTLVELLRYWASFQPDKTVYTFLVDGENQEESLSYSALDQQARSIAALLQSKTEPGSRILLLYPSGLDFIAAFFGCLYAGVIAVPSYPPRSKKADPRLEAIISDAQTALTLTTEKILAQMDLTGEAFAGLSQSGLFSTDGLSMEAAEKWSYPEVNQKTVAFLQYTSGSTSKPKGVMVTHGNILANEMMIKQAFGHDQNSTLVGWLPFFHDMGLIGNLLQPIYLGSHCTLLSPAHFFQKPLRWLQAISRYQPHTSGGPNFSYDLCAAKITPEQRKTLDLSGWRIAFNGAETVRAQTMERFSQAFQECGFRPQAFFPCYGLAEATLFVTGGVKDQLFRSENFDGESLERKEVVPMDSAPERCRTLVSCGRLTLDQKILIVDPETAVPCPPDRVGEVWITGKNVAQGYWNNAEASRDTFHACLDIESEAAFLRTGDLGFLKGDELYITGRLKDLIIIRGRNYYPQDIELTAESCHEALAPNCCAAFPVRVEEEERLAIACELKHSLRKTDPDDIINAVCQTVVHDYGIHPYAVVLLKPYSIPKTSSGKIQRHLCQKYYEENELQIIASRILDSNDSDSKAPDDSDLASAITDGVLFDEDESWEKRQSGLEGSLLKLVAKIVKTDPAKLDISQPLIALGIDSMLAVELQNLLESQYQLEIPVGELLDGLQISQIAALIMEKNGLEQIPRRLQGKIEFLPIEAVGRNSILPLSYEQEEMWLLDQITPGNPAYHIPVGIRVKGGLDISLLERSVNEVIRRHELLHTVFREQKGKPYQTPAPVSVIRIPLIDLISFPDANQAAEIQRIAFEEITRSFNLRQGPLLRVSVLRLGPVEHILLITAHHIISDILSLGLLLKETGIFYTAFSTGQPAVLPELTIQYGDYAYWQRNFVSGAMLEQQLSYWRGRLAQAPPFLSLPTDRPRPKIQRANCKHYFLTIPAGLTGLVRGFSRENGVTVFTTLLSAFNVLLYRYTKQHDLSVGTPVNGRYRAELRDLIGFFANPLVIRTDVSGNPQFVQLLQRVYQVTTEAFSNQEAPFFEVVKALRVKRDPGYYPLFQVMLSLVNSPLSSAGLSGVTLELLELETVSAYFDLFLFIYDQGNELSCAWGYNTDLFNQETIANLAGFYLQILQTSTKQPETSIDQFQLPQNLQRKFENWDLAPQKRAVNLNIAATFTAEPLKDALTFWMGQLDFPAEISFAPYNQVFQQLLDPVSSFAANRNGINIILLRFEDWFKYGETNSREREVIVRARQNTLEFVSALKSAVQRANIPYLVCLCPSNPDQTEWSSFFKEMESDLSDELKNIAGLYLIRLAEITELYPVGDYYDPYTDKIASLPYTQEFFTALGSILARHIFALNNPSYKVIVLDCDQTLWQGVCGEDGADGVQITAPYQELQSFMSKRQEAGMLLCLCSKNRPEDVWAVFQNHPEMLLKREQLIAARINWEPKSANLRALAEELGLGLDSLIFIDDNPVECAEVKANCPEVLTLQLPARSAEIPKFLAHVWAFDCITVTETDRNRTRLYQENAAREEFQQNSASYEEFLAGLKLEIRASKLTQETLPRVSQLTRRTNQFNFTTIRRSEPEIEILCLQGNFECLAFEVRDRFGDYGLVGVIIFAEKAGALNIDTFLLSCRALGRGVERRMMGRIAEIAKERGCMNIIIPFIPTERNRPALDFLNSISQSSPSSTDNGIVFRLSAEPELINRLHDNVKPQSIPQAAAASDGMAVFNGTTVSDSGKVKAPVGTGGVLASTELPAQADLIARAERLAKVNLLEYIANELNDTARILSRVNSGKKLQLNHQGAKALASTPIERKLAEIWSEILKLDQIGIHDDFFELGGHSILATQILSRVRQAFQVEIPMELLFTGTFTIAKLAKEVIHQQLKLYDNQVIAAKLKMLNSLSEEEIQKLLS